MDNAHEVLKKLEKLGETEFLPSIGPLKGKIVEKVIKEHKPKTILEVGTLYGYSAILMARLLPPAGKVITIEKDENSAKTARKYIEEAGLSEKIEVIAGDALDVIPKLKETFDMLFLDATKDEYYKYLKLAERNLKKGSVVMADNVGIFEDEMRDYLEYVRNSGKYGSKTANVRMDFSKDEWDAMEISIYLEKTK
jgi:predicted O-methyltransferase YrrM